MDNLSRAACLVEAVVKGVLKRYLANLHTEDYQRRALNQTIEELPGIVSDALKEIRTARARLHRGPRLGRRLRE